MQKTPLRFDIPIQKARWLNQEGTKVETRTRAEKSEEGTQILTDVRGAVGNPKTTRSYACRIAAPPGMKMAFYRNGTSPLYR
jgi:hypothetical protein